MPLYVTDYLGDTMHLTTEQHGAYLLLLMACWKGDGYLAADDDSLAAITRLGPSRWKAHRSTLLRFFTVGTETISHGRVIEERAKAKETSSARKASGATGAAAKWGGSLDAQNRGKRSERLANARRLATHLPAEWSAMLDICGPHCLRCGAEAPLVKDHIQPIYQGGSDGIENIQPLCRSCNSSKGPDTTDLRPNGWQTSLAKRLANACGTPTPSPSPVLEANTPTEYSSASAACPHKEIIALYHECLPELARVKTWEGSRPISLRARWREDKKRQSLDYWRRFFMHVSKSDFLMGRTASKDRTPFVADLEWLITARNFAKVIEGKYHAR
jgi:uncharacterized protein YdaU (DUF1376 family)